MTTIVSPKIEDVIYSPYVQKNIEYHLRNIPPQHKEDVRQYAYLRILEGLPNLKNEKSIKPFCVKAAIFAIKEWWVKYYKVKDTASLDALIKSMGHDSMLDLCLKDCAIPLQMIESEYDLCLTAKVYSVNRECFSPSERMVLDAVIVDRRYLIYEPEAKAELAAELGIDRALITRAFKKFRRYCS